MAAAAIPLELFQADSMAFYQSNWYAPGLGDSAFRCNAVCSHVMNQTLRSCLQRNIFIQQASDIHSFIYGGMADGTSSFAMTLRASPDHGDRQLSVRLMSSIVHHPRPGNH